MKMDVVQPPTGASWGKFNNRAINDDWVKKLSTSFEDSLDSCTDQTSMDVALDPEWLENRTSIVPSVEGLNIDDVPQIRFNPTGSAAIQRNNLWMLSGNHRRLAVVKYVMQLQKELDDANAAIDEITTKQNTDDQVDDSFNGAENRLKEAQDLVSSLEAKIKTSRFWTVRIYDRGTSPMSLPYPDHPSLTTPSFSQDRERVHLSGKGSLPLHFQERDVGDPSRNR